MTRITPACERSQRALTQDETREHKTEKIPYSSQAYGGVEQSGVCKWV